MYKALVSLAALAFAFAFLIPASAQAVTTLDVVNQISQTSFQSYPTSLPTHSGGLNGAVVNSSPSGEPNSSAALASAPGDPAALPKGGAR